MNPESISPPRPVLSEMAGPSREAARNSFLNRAWPALAAAFVAVRALPLLSVLLGQDQAMYLLFGEALLKGKQPYRDILESKPPGILILYAGFAKLFGRSMWSAAVVDILLLLVISYLLFQFVEPYLGRAGAAIAVMVHASMYGEMTYFWIAQAETFQLVCVLAGFLLLRRSGRWSSPSCFAAGFLLGYACWLKYSAVAFLPFLVLFPDLDAKELDQQPRRFSLLIAWRSWFGKAAALTAGLATGIGIVLAWIVFKGNWPAMWDMQFHVVPRYAAMAVQRNPHYLLAIFARTNYRVGVANLWAVLAALLLAWSRRDLRRFAPLFAGAASAYLGAVMQLRFYDYYFQTCFPFLAAVWAYLLIRFYEGACAWARSFRQQGWRLAAVLVWLVFANVIFWPLPEEFGRLTERYEELREWSMNSESFYRNYPRQVGFDHLHGEFSVIDYLQKNAKPSDGIFVWAAMCRIYYLTGHQPTTRFVSHYGIMALWSPPSWRNELMRGLEKSRPRFIVVGRDDKLPGLTYVNLDSEQYLATFPQLQAFITGNYSPVASFESCVVYRRIGDAGTS
jgi:hypothetical protein